MKAPSSMKARLCLFFALLLLLAWGLSAALAWQDARETIDEFFDTQQMLFAKRLATSDLPSLVQSLPKTKKMLPGDKKKARGDEDEDALSFAVFSRTGELLLDDGEKGGDFAFTDRRGFVNMRIRDSDDKWRIVWLDALDGMSVIAVGQEQDYRDDMAEDLVERQLWPWLLLLPVLLLGVYGIVALELRPLRQVTHQLENRKPDDATPIAVHRLPAESQPLLHALNALFLKIHSQIQRERAFTADAAHELRTPITALKVQAEVAQLAKNPQKQHAALQKMTQGINRAANLIDQMLALTRLETQAAHEQAHHAVNTDPEQNTSKETFMQLFHQHMVALSPLIVNKSLVLRQPLIQPPTVTAAPAAMLAIMTRNILDNAVRYTPPQGVVRITLSHDSLEVSNSTVLDASYLRAEQVNRLTERFYRPPGQNERGSGLGLSIIQRVAELYGFTFSICCTPPSEEFCGSSPKPTGMVFHLRIGLR